VDTVIYGLLFGGVGLAVGLFVVSGVVEQIKKRGRGESDNWDSRAAERHPAGPRPDPWEAVRAVDPDFSAVLFEDFVYTLYSTAQRARHATAALARLGPYLSPGVRAILHNRIPQGAPVVAVVMGAVRVEKVTVKPGGEQLAVIDVEANLTARATDGMRGEYVQESWTLSRAPGTHTRAWTGVRTFGCPACGAPIEASDDDRCASCGQVLAGGRFDWQVVDTAMQEWDERPPALLGEDAEEQGTDRPTVVDRGLGASRAALARDDAGFSEEQLFRRLDAIYTALNASWAAQDLRPVRPYASDAMFNYLSYWVEAYREQGLCNAVESPRITRRETARIRRDRHFDAVTVRLWATGYEVTTEAATDTVLRGSRTRERPYSEYWTLIRGASVRGAPRAEPNCPSCGAPLDVNMAGHCAHCGVHVTSGEFDWVLSRIEQDDSYEG
jgi:predicted lipid-binding transport protein (Tim44 family)